MIVHASSHSGRGARCSAWFDVARTLGQGARALPQDTVGMSSQRRRPLATFVLAVLAPPAVWAFAGRPRAATLMFLLGAGALASCLGLSLDIPGAMLGALAIGLTLFAAALRSG